MTEKEKAMELLDRILAHNLNENAYQLTIDYIGADNMHLLENLDVDDIIRMTAPAAFAAGVKFAAENTEEWAE